MIMMKEEKNYLPQYTLDRLAEYVCLPLEHFDRFYPETMWTNVIPECARIEKHPQNVTSVTKKAKLTRKWCPRQGVMDYHQFLTRVFALLYYRHSGDKIYQTIVFPELVRNMGLYAEDSILKEKICKGIDKLLEEDRLVAAENSKKSSDRQLLENCYDDEDSEYSASNIVLKPVRGEHFRSHEAVGELPADDAGDEVTVGGVLHNKVCFELFVRLLQKAGFDENNTGNKSRAGELWHMVTGKSGEEFRRFCSLRNYANSHTKADIELLNEKLKGMGIDIEL